MRQELFDAVLHDSTDTQYGSRKCDAAWLKLQNLPAHRKLRKLVKASNDRWHLLPKKNGAASAASTRMPQYTEYRGDREAHFKQWHLDAHEGGEDAEDARAITSVVLLTEPGVDFPGRRFEVGCGRNGRAASRRPWTGGEATSSPFPLVKCGTASCRQRGASDGR